MSAKLEAFNQVPFDTIRGCVDDPLTNCVRHTFDDPPESALALFSGPYRPEGVDRVEFETVFGPVGHEDCPPQLPGFNAFDQNNNGNAARWGFFNNIPGQRCQPEPTDDSDGTIGWGLQTDGNDPQGAGLHNFGTNNGSRESWLWVK